MGGIGIGNIELIRLQRRATWMISECRKGSVMSKKVLEMLKHAVKEAGVLIKSLIEKKYALPLRLRIVMIVIVFFCMLHTTIEAYFVPIFQGGQQCSSREAI